MSRESILIVDDEPVNIDIIASLLGESYDLRVATNGKDAIEFLKKTEVNLILLDISMPGMDGFETCSILKKEPKTRDIPIIFITANSDEKSIEKAYDVGGVDYITKPFKFKELVAKVNRELQLSSLIKKS